MRNPRFVALISLAAVLFSTLTFAQHYTQTNLVSNVPGKAPVTDPNLQNPWGLVASSTSPWWVSNNAGGNHCSAGGNGPECPQPAGAWFPDRNHVQRKRD